MIETISYRATKRLPTSIREQTQQNRPTKIIGLNETMLKLSELPTQPLSISTIIIIELSKKQTNIQKIIILLTQLHDENLLSLIYVAQPEETTIKTLKKHLTQNTKIWEQYNKDMKFSLKVDKYYQQLEIYLKTKTKNHPADSLH